MIVVNLPSIYFPDSVIIIATLNIVADFRILRGMCVSDFSRLKSLHCGRFWEEVSLTEAVLIFLLIANLFAEGENDLKVDFPVSDLLLFT